MRIAAIAIFFMLILISQASAEEIVVPLDNEGATEPLVEAALPEPAKPAEKKAAKEEPKKWYDRIFWSGDFRLRQEYRGTETWSSSAGEYAPCDKVRARMRARLGMEAELSGNMKFIAGLATGFGALGNGSDDDPASANQTFEDAYAAKPFNLEYAAILWNPIAPKYEEKDGSKTPVSGFLAELAAGKTRIPFTTPQKSSLIWDGAVCPEGVTGRITAFIGPKGAFAPFLFAGHFFMDEVDGKAFLHDNASSMDAVQLGANWKISKSVSLLVGYSYYGYVNAEDHKPFYKANGNTLNGSVYANGFYLSNLFFDFGVKAVNRPLNFYADCVKNAGADDNNLGYLAGVRFGSVKKAWDWEIQSYYRRLQADAAVGCYIGTDLTSGSTDSKGFCVGASIGLSDSATFTATNYFGEIGLDSDHPARDNRVQLDVIIKF